MQSKYKYIIFCVFLLSFSACKNNEGQNFRTQNGASEEVFLPEDFEVFFTKFHSDSLYQMEHIVFPLEGMNSSIDPTATYYWEKESWKLHGEYDESLTDFNRSFQIYNGIVIETIQDKYAFSKMERRFAKLGDDWMLIYYALTTANQ